MASRARRLLAAAGLPATLVVAGTAAAGGGPAASSREAGPPTATQAWVAQVVAATRVRARPDGPVTGRLGTIAPWAGGPVSLLVLHTVRDEHGALWLDVRLQSRPNDATGWIPADHTVLRDTPWRIVLDRSSRTLSVLRAGHRVRRMLAVVGAPGTPTPVGHFAIAERVRQGAGSELGPWALHLTAHSRVLENFGGGPGRVAIHGRAGPLLADPLGTARSHGCIRVASAQIAWLAARVREGTPVDVRR